MNSKMFKIRHYIPHIISTTDKPTDTIQNHFNLEINIQLFAHDSVMRNLSYIIKDFAC